MLQKLHNGGIWNGLLIPGLGWHSCSLVITTYICFYKEGKQPGGKVFCGGDLLSVAYLIFSLLYFFDL